MVKYTTNRLYPQASLGYSASKFINWCWQDLVRKGVPHHFRGMVWQLLCEAHESPAKHKYAEYLKQNSACEKVIRRDITRTYPEHDFFREKDGLGQESLFNVMKVTLTLSPCHAESSPLSLPQC